MVLLEVVESMDFLVSMYLIIQCLLVCLFVFIQKQNEKDFE